MLFFKVLITYRRFQIEEEHTANINHSKLEFLKTLKEDVGVDMTPYLIAKETNVDKTIKVIGQDSNTNLLVST